MNVTATSREAQAAGLEQELAQFTGSTQLYRHWSGRLQYTEGVKALADRAGAHWLIDVVASHQTKAALRRMDGFQLWELTVRPDKTATLVCRADSHARPAIHQEIEFTDFPLAELAFYVEEDVMLLRSEH